MADASKRGPLERQESRTLSIRRQHSDEDDGKSGSPWPMQYGNDRWVITDHMIVCCAAPENTKHLCNICTMLDQRRRRWTDVVQMLYKCFVFAGAYYSTDHIVEQFG